MDNTGKTKGIILWIGCVLLTLLFILSGVGKISNPAGAAKMFEHFGYPGWFGMVIGAVEIMSGIALLIPRLSTYAAGVLGVVMLGAIVSHLRVAEWNRVGFTVVLFAILGFVGMARRQKKPGA